ncbi:MAG: tRNA lysidine(34) synthetase TilS [Deltaproteobacteria bacterium]|jgi:tRNA(Ile)-lysidine synthase|nr:tRNA lysidine(34) synthetase TilS [Deltaproteobacteria bacterium]MBT4526452.1 tRNA lysidine(34) synthetase TilS [Deltaproteobacteria bacterium]
MDKFTYRIFKFSTENQLIQNNDQVLISLSGGIDSLSLYLLMNDFKEKINIKLHLVHFHHGLRVESNQEVEFLKELAGQNNTPITIIKTKQFENKKGMQNLARNWRYENLERMNRELDFDKIATAHQLDDLIESQIWRILRGGSLFTLNAIQLHMPPYIRPLLQITKAELKNYLESRNQKWCEDASNIEDNYTRNKIRNKIIPLLKETSGGNFEEKFLALNEDAIDLKGYFNQIVTPKTYESQDLSFKAVQMLNPVFARELIYRFLIHHDQTEVTRANIKDIYKMIIQDLGNWKIQLKRNYAVFGKSKKIIIVSNQNRSMP